LDESRSSQRSQQSLSNPSKRQDESSIDKYHRPASRSSKEDLLALVSNQSSYHSRPAASSAIDGRSSPSAIERSKSSRFINEPTSPLVSNRDLTSKPPTDPSYRPKSAARQTLDSSSHRPTRSKFDYLYNQSSFLVFFQAQIYSSAYGTIPMDDF
jgi:hypothetical protein